MALTREQLIKNVEAMESQGADAGEIQDYLDQQKAPPPASAPQRSTFQKGVDLLAGAGAAIGGVGTGMLKGAASTSAGALELTDKYVVDPLVRAVGRKPSSREGYAFTREKLAPKTTAEKVGFGIEKFAEAAVPIPVGKASALRSATGVVRPPKLGAKIVAGLGRTAKEVAEQAGKSFVQEGGDLGKVRDVAGTTALVSGGLNVALPIAGTFVNGAAKFISSRLSGVPVDAIDKALRNPETVRAAIRKAADQGDEAALHIVTRAKEALDDLKNVRGEQYESALERIGRDTWLTQNGRLYVREGAEATGTPGPWVQTKLTLKGLKDQITTTLNKFNVRGSGGAYDFSRTAIPKSMQADLQEIAERAYAWDDMTPLGLNQLRKIIDSYKKDVGQFSPSANKQFNAMVTGLRENLSTYVGQRVPQIAELNKTYAAQTKVIEDIVENLNLESKASVALRTLMNSFSSKNPATQKMLRELGAKTGTDLQADIAGVLMSRLVPDSLGSTIVASGGTLAAAGAGGAAGGIPGAVMSILAALTAGSPRVVGETATAAGQAARAIAPVAQQLKRAGTAAGATFLPPGRQ